MKDRLFLGVIILPMILFANAAGVKERIPVQLKSCKFSVTVPEGWDTIPQSALAQKLGEDVAVMGLYPEGKSDYFEEKYMILSFLPTVKSLNNLPFKEIFDEMKGMTKQSSIPNNHSLRVVYNGIERFSNEGKFWIRTSMAVCKDSASINCLQNLLLSKFGYISVTYYDKNFVASDPENAVQKIVQDIEVDNEYKYDEPQEETAFTPTKIAIAVGVGIFVYLIIVLFDKRKKKDE